MAQDEMIQKLLSDLKEKVKEVEEIYNTLQTLKKYGAPIEIPELRNLMGTSEGMKIETRQANGLSIRPDEFYGMSNTEAAEKYLRQVGHAASLENIFDVLVRGGIRFSGDGRKNLNIQLTRATRKFAKIGRGSDVNFGMLEWYPKRIRTAPVKTTEEKTEEEENVTEKYKEKSE